MQRNSFPGTYQEKWRHTSTRRTLTAALFKAALNWKHPGWPRTEGKPSSTPWFALLEVLTPRRERNRALMPRQHEWVSGTLCGAEEVAAKGLVLWEQQTEAVGMEVRAELAQEGRGWPREGRAISGAAHNPYLNPGGNPTAACIYQNCWNDTSRCAHFNFLFNLKKEKEKKCQCSPVSDSNQPPLGGYGIWFYHVHPFYCLTVASSLSLECRISFFGGFQCPPVDGISTASCNFGAFAGIDEHMSFYFAILNWKPKWTYLKTEIDI